MYAMYNGPEKVVNGNLPECKRSHLESSAKLHEHCRFVAERMLEIVDQIHTKYVNCF